MPGQRDVLNSTLKNPTRRTPERKRASRTHDNRIWGSEVNLILLKFCGCHCARAQPWREVHETVQRSIIAPLLRDEPDAAWALGAFVVISLTYFFAASGGGPVTEYWLGSALWQARKNSLEAKGAPANQDERRR